VQALKYEAALANARVLGTLLADAAAGQGLAGTMDAVIPMPLHESRLVARGFNQSYELARFVSRSLAIPCDVRALHRTRVTQPQVALSRSARRDNVRGAFVADRARVAGRRLILLDDVITTGSTVAAAASALRSAGAAEVQAWSVARALA
jgi:ComF family protein